MSRKSLIGHHEALESGAAGQRPAPGRRRGVRGFPGDLHSKESVGQALAGHGEDPEEGEAAFLELFSGHAGMPSWQGKEPATARRACSSSGESHAERRAEGRAERRAGAFSLDSPEGKRQYATAWRDDLESVVFGKGSPTAEEKRAEHAWLHGDAVGKPVAGFEPPPRGKRTFRSGETQGRILQLSEPPAPRALVDAESPPLPTLFISHGPGPWPLLWDPSSPAVTCLRELPVKQGLLPPAVQAIVIVSAHWETRHGVEVTYHRDTVYGQPPLHDSFSVPEEIYRIASRFHPPGCPALSDRVLAALRVRRLQAQADINRKLDQGVFVPLLLMEGLASLPVVQVSLPALGERSAEQNARVALEIGRALAPLRREGVLLVGSGQATHGQGPTDTSGRSEEFVAALRHACVDLDPSQRSRALERWHSSLPHARLVHGREEHLLPLHVALGAAEGERGKVLGDFRCPDGAALLHVRFGERAGHGRGPPGRR